MKSEMKYTHPRETRSRFAWSRLQSQERLKKGTKGTKRTKEEAAGSASFIGDNSDKGMGLLHAN